VPITAFVHTALKERLVPMLSLGCIAAAFPAVVIALVGTRAVEVDATVHFYAVGVTALIAAAAAVALTIVGARYGDTRTVLVGTAFAVMAALLALHGLATPGFIFGWNGVIMFTGGATLPAGAAILALSVLPLPRFLSGVRPLVVAEGVLLVLVLGLGVAALAFPDLVPGVPAVGSPGAIALMVVGLVLFAILAWRALRTFLLTRRLADMAVAVGIVWLGTSLVAALTLTYLQLGWWLGHALELDAMLVVGITVALDLARTTQSRPLAGDLHAVELVHAEERFLGSHVRALTVVLAQRDGYTEQHTRRVAVRAVQVGERLGLSTSRLRTLAIGGLVHDIDKLSVPDSILKKPGPLTDEEYAVIKRHPEWGTKLLDEIGGFSGAVRRLVRDHHERLDGLGYPGGLASEEIELDTRILTVCDVYDALISSRVYRPAWTHDEAIAILREQVGTAFDARCVGALEGVLEEEHGKAKERERARAAASAQVQPARAAFAS
jgi:HD-GYP domain-containing protein (c-di-GMP phosphodiesterase class II)